MLHRRLPAYVQRIALPVLLVLAALCSAPAALARALHLGDRPLRAGVSGTDVKQLQRLLVKVGIKTHVDGQYGTGTKRAVVRFQRTEGLQPSGVVGPVTVTALEKAATVSGGAAQFQTGGTDGTDGTQTARSLGDRIPVQEGMSGHDIKELQDFLSRLGYKVTIDGGFGPDTTTAVKKFQKDQKLPVTGVLDANGIAVLRQQVGAGATGSTGSTGSTGATGTTGSTAPAPLAPGDKATVGSDGLAIAPASAPQVVKDVIAAGNEIAKKPYVYGGGHGRWNDSGYDCSGSVSYALHGGGLLDTQMDSTELESYGSAGPGQWITIYANSGHAFMYVAGLRFDTSGQSDTGSRWQAASRSTSGYVVRHPTGY